jgi:hypothetical protein
MISNSGIYFSHKVLLSNGKYLRILSNSSSWSSSLAKWSSQPASIHFITVPYSATPRFLARNA